MKISLDSSVGWRLLEPPFSFQRTYITPLPDLCRFVMALLQPFEISSGDLWIEQIIFRPGELIWYLRGLGIIADEGQLNKSILYAEKKSEVFDLLECVLGQWTDFVFFPSSKKFAIYADHDEYLTIFTPSAEVLDSLRKQMKLQGFKEAEGWMWTRPPSPANIEGTNPNV